MPPSPRTSPRWITGAVLCWMLILCLVFLSQVSPPASASGRGAPAASAQVAVNR